MSLHLVAYTIATRGGVEGAGTITWDLPVTPATYDDVVALSREISEISWGRGTLHQDQIASVSAWSPMGVKQ